MQAEDEQLHLEAEKKAKESHGQMVAALYSQTGLSVDKAFYDASSPTNKYN